MLMLILHVGEDSYCCSCDPIIEIVPRVSLRQVPRSSSYISGLLNYAGESVPVVDLSMVLKGRPSKDSMHTRIVLFKSSLRGENTKVMALIAENIVETREIDENLFKESGIQIQDYPFLDGIYSTESESIMQINIDQFFNSLSDIKNG